jgi:hypothetical protein
MRAPPAPRASHPRAGGRGDGRRERAAGIGLHEARYGNATPPTSAIPEVIVRRNRAAGVQAARRHSGEKRRGIRRPALRRS